MSGDTLDFLQGTRETLTGTLHDPAATTGHVLTVQADKSIKAAAGGGSTPFDPSQLSPALWFKADAIVGISDGDPLPAWPDSSGNGQDATQSDEASRPIYVAAARNGLPIVRFAADPDDQWLDVLGALDVLRAKPGATVAIVGLRYGLFNDWDPFWISTTADPTSPRFAMNDGQPYADPADTGAPGFAGFGVSTSLGDLPWTACVYFAKFVEGNVYIEMDVPIPQQMQAVSNVGGVLTQGQTSLVVNHSPNHVHAVGPIFGPIPQWKDGLPAAGPAYAPAPLSADSDSALVQINRHDGSTYGGAKDLGEILVFGRCLSYGERAALLGYLATKWDTP